MATRLKQLCLLLALLLAFTMFPAPALADGTDGQPEEPILEPIPAEAWEAYGESGTENTERTIRQEQWEEPVTMTVSIRSENYTLDDLQLTYQWYVQTSTEPVVWTALENATEANCTTVCEDAEYRCDVTDRSGNKRTVLYTIWRGVSLNGAVVTLDPKQSLTYCGRAIKPSCTLTLTDGTVLNSRKDTVRITYSPSSPINVGTVYMTVEGFGKYYDSVRTSYKITAAQIYHLDYRYTRSMTYTGRGLNPTLSIFDRNAEMYLLEDTDYTYQYKNNRNVGMGEIHIQGKRNYSKSMVVLFYILPPKTSFTSVTAGKKKLTARWNKVTSQTTGYQVQVATNQRFSKGKKTVTISTTATTAKTITGLKAKHKYYIKVRTYKTRGGTRYYSNWSAATKIYTK